MSEEHQPKFLEDEIAQIEKEILLQISRVQGKATAPGSTPGGSAGAVGGRLTAPPTIPTRSNATRQYVQGQFEEKVQTLGTKVKRIAEELNKGTGKAKERAEALQETLDNVRSNLDGVLERHSNPAALSAKTSLSAKK